MEGKQRQKWDKMRPKTHEVIKVALLIHSFTEHIRDCWELCIVLHIRDIKMRK